MGKLRILQLDPLKNVTDPDLLLQKYPHIPVEILSNIFSVIFYALVSTSKNMFYGRLVLFGVAGGVRYTV